MLIKHSFKKQTTHLKNPTDVGYIVDMLVHIQICPSWLQHIQKKIEDNFDQYFNECNQGIHT